MPGHSPAAFALRAEAIEHLEAQLGGWRARIGVHKNLADLACAAAFEWPAGPDYRFAEFDAREAGPKSPRMRDVALA